MFKKWNKSSCHWWRQFSINIIYTFYFRQNIQYMANLLDSFDSILLERFVCYFYDRSSSVHADLCSFCRMYHVYQCSMESFCNGVLNRIIKSSDFYWIFCSIYCSSKCTRSSKFNTMIHPNNANSICRSVCVQKHRNNLNRIVHIFYRKTQVQQV